MSKGNICPCCGERIYHLINVQSGSKCWKFDGGLNYEEEGFYPDDMVNDWVCPECDEVIAEEEEDAILFLKGGVKDEG